MQALLEGLTQEEQSIVCFRDGRITRVGGMLRTTVAIG